MRNPLWQTLWLVVLSLCGNLSAAEADDWTHGRKSLLFMRFDFPDRPGEPVPMKQARDIMQEANQFYTANSGGLYSITATITPVIRLPQTTARYTANMGQFSIDTHARAKAAGYDVDRFDLEVVATIPFPGKGSSGVHGRKGLSLSSFAPRTVAHELGHNLGLYHAAFWQTEDGSVIGPGKEVGYGNRFDLMGGATARPLTVLHFNVWSKSLLGWLPDTAIQNVTESGTYRLYAQDMPGASGLRALKIKDNETRNYWVEFRQLIQDNRLLTNGALVFWGHNDRRNRSHLLDMTPGSPGGAEDAPLLIGRTFSDTANDIHITPLRKVFGNVPALDVVVNLKRPTPNRPPALALRAEAEAVPSGRPVSITATASDPDGDELVYFWESSDGDFGNGPSTVTKKFGTRGIYVVRCTVSDMWGGTATATTEVRVGTIIGPAPQPGTLPATPPVTTPPAPTVPQPVAPPAAPATPASPAPTTTLPANPPANPVEVKRGAALHLRGNPDCVEAPALKGLPPGNVPHTVEMWLRPDALPTPPRQGWVVCLGNHQKGAHRWRWNSDGRLEMGVWGSALIFVKVPVNEWTHLAAVFDGKTLTGYMNGEPFGTSPAQFDLQGVPLVIGKQAPLKNQDPLRGAVDEVRVWNRARAPEAIRQDATRAITGVQTGLICHWRLDEGSGDVAHDLSGNANAGHLAGAPQWMPSAPIR